MKKLLKIFRSSFLWLLLAPWVVYGIGYTSNELVLISNHDKFPVMINQARLEQFHNTPTLAEILSGQKNDLPPDMIDDTHCVMSDQTHLNFLSDVIRIGPATVSIGDLILFAGQWLQTWCPFVWIALIFKKCWDADAV